LIAEASPRASFGVGDKCDGVPNRARTSFLVLETSIAQMPIALFPIPNLAADELKYQRIALMAFSDFSFWITCVSFILSGLSGLSLGVVPCVGAKLGPHLKARKHFFKVFSTVRKVLSCGAATQRDEKPLARFHADNNPPRLTVADDGLPRLRSAHRSRKKPLRWNSPCQRAVPVQYSPRRQSRRRADSDRLKSLFHRPFRAALIRGGSDAEGATFHHVTNDIQNGRSARPFRENPE